MDEMYHHGILGQKWGVRRFQNKDGTLTAAGQKRLEKKDAKWAHRNHDKIVSKARKDVSKELDQYANQLLKNPSSVTSKGKISSSAINSYNRKMAELMNESARSQHQSISFFRDPFKLVPVNDIAEIADKFTRNEIMTSNEIRQVVGMKPSEDPRADELRNKNLSAPSGSDQQSEEMPITEVNSAEESASDLDDKISKQKSKK